ERVADRLERLRYARGGSGGSSGGPVTAVSLAEDGALCVTALEQGATARVRRTARWWPRSLLHRGTRMRPSRSSRTEPLGGGGVVERVG
ncbi:MAG: t, partial [Nocardioides sp.]|nr:t [Nocardioides sp.]